MLFTQQIDIFMAVERTQFGKKFWLSLFLKKCNCCAKNKNLEDGNQNLLTLVFLFIANRNSDGIKLTKLFCRTSFQFENETEMNVLKFIL